MQALLTSSLASVFEYSAHALLSLRAPISFSALRTTSPISNSLKGSFFFFFMVYYLHEMKYALVYLFDDNLSEHKIAYMRLKQHKNNNYFVVAIALHPFQHPRNQSSSTAREILCPGITYVHNFRVLWKQELCGEIFLAV